MRARHPPSHSGDTGDASFLFSPGSSPPGSPQPDFGLWNYINIARLEEANNELIQRYSSSASLKKIAK
ncbi:hypothetical protein PAPYR_11149 [Paratrimastix pyriformis]|uniref:Uncharacterized protein n=1 Tax=Paratrimastix pyriformis TaxID=342808 RepID=A0ABQ8UBL8_9EUKA|nr:hypothetical protein PAPYR_11149 [Paratrimastix pyriformis]